MTKHTLFKIQKKEVVNAAGMECVFYFKAYQGNTMKTGSYLHHRRDVELSGYRIVIELAISYGNEVVDFKEHDFGYICARSGQLAYILSEMRKVDSFETMVEIGEKYALEFDEVFQRDAKRELKKSLHSMQMRNKTKSNPQDDSRKRFLDRTNKMAEEMQSKNKKKQPFSQAIKEAESIICKKDK